MYLLPYHLKLPDCLKRWRSREPLGQLVPQNVLHRLMHRTLLHHQTKKHIPQVLLLNTNKANICIPSTLKLLLQTPEAPLSRTDVQPTQILSVLKFLCRDPQHAFPNQLLTTKFLVDVLSTASLHIPNVEDVHVCLLWDHDIKERCTAAIAPLLVLNTPTAVKDLINKIKDDYNYIFPWHLQGKPNVLIGLLQTRNLSFVTKHQDQFPSCTGTNGDIIWEVPKAMVALVSTAYYAALSLAARGWLNLL
ncbi:hypothetical protein V8E53_000145 [Lactarius tabidus]